MDNNAMHKISYGLFVLTAQENGKQNGCIVNTVAQVTSTPNRVTVAVNRGNYTNEMIKRTGKFNVSVINEEVHFSLFERFGFQSGRDVDKFENWGGFAKAKNGINYITVGTNAVISAEVEQVVELDTHTLFIAKVTDAKVLNDVASTTYAYYLKNIKPQPKAPAKTEEGKIIWRCVICGYEYEGEELPADFICPLCKHPASDFRKENG